MFVARPISALGGLLVLIVLSRTLSKSDYGIYFALWASAEILILASTFGLVQSVYRYVSAAELFTGQLCPQGPVFPLLGWRVITLSLAAIGAASFPAILASLAGIPSLPEWVPLIFAVIVFGEGLARFLETLFDAMLSQGRSQLTLVSRTVFRLMGFLFFYLDGALTLSDVLFVEVAVTVGGSCLGLILIGHIYWRRFSAPAIKTEPHCYRRMAKYALPTFLSDLIGIGYSVDFLKIVLAKTSGLEAVAAFGFAYSLAAVIQRYMPANLFAGIFRPVFIAASKKADSKVLLNGLVNVIIKINWLLILPVLCFLGFGSSYFLSALSGGNYVNSGGILLLLIAALLLRAVRFTLSMFCLARENSVYPLASTLFALIGLPIAIHLSTLYGAEGMGIALGISESVWILACLALFRYKSSDPLKLDGGALTKMLGASFLATGLGWVLDKAGMSLYFVGPISAASCLLSMYFFSIFSGQEKNWLISILPIPKRLTKFMQ